jgi:uncharacterized protein YjbI with pentapeptide repeats
MWDQALLRMLATMMASIGFLVTVAQAQEGGADQPCPHGLGWRPRAEELAQLVNTTLEPARKPNFCNADLRGAELSNKDLRGAKLNNANLRSAELNNANLSGAELNSAILYRAKLTNAKLFGAKLNNADLRRAELKNADLITAKLNKADLRRAELNNAHLNGAELNDAILQEAELNNAHLNGAELNRAKLQGAELNNAYLNAAKLDNAKLQSTKLNNASLNRAKLTNADLFGAELKDTLLALAELTEANYAPVSPPPNAYVAGIIGLETVHFPEGREIGLIQLRELLQKAGLREEERQTTYAIESGRTRHALTAWRNNPGAATEGLFRLVAFDLTTAYGLHPTRALKTLTVLWALLIPIYWWTIRDHLLWPTGLAGIYRIWPRDRIEVHTGISALESAAKVERLYGSDLAALGWSAWFSLLSAFYIGFREFSVGTWLSRVHPRQFVLEATGWVRTVSGLQSLISLYLLAIWVLTYFGRPFQ